MPFRVRLFLFALAYWMGAELSYLLLLKTDNFVAFWPPAGLYLALLLATPQRRWWAVVLTASVPNFLSDAVIHQHTLPVSLGLLLINLGAPLVGAAILVRLCRSSFSFAHLPHVLCWSAIISLVSTPLGALGGATLFMSADGTAFAPKMLFWWLGDLLGILLVTPLAYGVLTERSWPRRAQVIEAAALLLSLGAATVLVFRPLGNFALPPTLLFFFLLWAALRFGASVVGAAAVLLAVISLWLTAAGFGPYGFQATLPARLLNAQLLVITGALLFYILAALMAGWRAAEDKLRNVNVELEQQVQARTAMLAEANEQLRASQERLQLGAEVAGFVLFEIDYETQTYHLSAEAAALYGLGEAAMTVPRAALQATFHPDDSPRLAALFEQSLEPAGDGKLSYEHRIVRPNGALRWLNVRKQVFFDHTQAPPRPVRGILAARDITARKRLEEDFRAQFDELENIYRTAPIGLALLDRDFRFVRINERLAEINGFPAQQHIGCTVREIVPDVADQAEAFFRQVFATGLPLLNVELKGETAAQPGVQRIWDESWYPLKNEAGVTVAINVVVEEITARKLAEKQLRASEEFNRTVLENSPDCVKILDTDGRLQYINANGLYEMEIDDFAPYANRLWWELWPPEMQPLVKAAVTQALRGEPAKLQGFCSTAKGTPKWWDVIVAPIPSPEGQLTRLTSVSRDITESKRQEQNIAFLVEMSKDFASLASASEIMAMAGARIRDYLKLSHCLFVEINEAANEAIVLHDECAANAQSLTGVYRLTDFHHASELQCLSAGQPLVISNVYREAADQQRTQQFEALDVRALLNAPYLRDGRWPFVLSALCDKPHEWQPHEIELLSELAERICLRLERAHAEEQLRQSEERYRALVQATAQIEWMAAPDGSFTRPQSAWESFTGQPFDDYRGSRWSAALHPDDRERTLTAWHQAIAEKSVYKIENRMRRYDGEYRWMSVRAVPILDPAGEICAWVGANTDITTRKEQEEKLRESEQRIRLATETAKIGIWEWNIVTDEVCWDAQMFAMYGIEPTADRLVDYTTWRAAVLPEDLPAQEAILQATIKNAGSSSRAFRIRRASDGKIRFIETIETVRTNSQGEIECVIGTNIDVTERKRLEEKIREQFEELENIYRTAPIGLALLDRDFRFVRINERLAEINGLPAQQHIGRTVRELVPNLADQAEALFQQIFATGEPVLNVELEGETNAQPGVRRSWNESWYPLKNEADETLGIALVVEEITERKRAEKALQRRNQQLDLLARVSQLLIFEERSEAEILETVFGEVSWAIGAEMFFNYQPDDEHTMRLNTWGGLTDDERECFAIMRYGELWCGRVAERRQPIIVEDIAHTQVEGSEAVRAANYGAYAGFPLVAGERLVGTIAFITRQQTHFAAGDVQMIQTICDQVATTLERLRLMKQLDASHNTFRHLVEHSPFGIYVVDADFRLAQVSVGAQKVFANVRPLLGRDFAEVLRVIWPERAASEFIARFRHTLATGEPYHAPSTVEERHDIGETEAYDWKIERLTLPDGRFGVVCHFYDLTERLQFEAKLRENEERLALALNSAAMGVWSWDLQTNAVHWSPESYFIYGRTSFDGTLTAFLQTVHPEDAERVLATVKGAIGNRVPYDAEFRIIRGDGSVRWVANRGRAEYDAMGQPLCMFGVIMDIEVRKQAEAERERLLAMEQQLRETAENATRAKDDFLSLVTHELRNPLNSILGYTRLTQTKAHDAAVVAHNCKIIERNAKVQQQLIDDLLDTARIVSGKLKIETAPTDLRLVIEEALTVVRPAAEAKQVELVAKFYGEQPQVIGDATRLQQVVWNLLQNSIKFTPKGGRVELCLQRIEQHLRIVVSDTGKGIEPDFLPHLFDRFSQNDTSRTRRFGGLGLGLALVKQLVELHGGTIAVESEGTNCGATFIIELPLQAPHHTTSARAVRAIAEINNGPESIPLTDLPRLDGVRVLVVDDMEDARTLVADTLSHWGAVVTTADSGQEAERQLAEAAFDVMICDIAMPDVDGYEVIRRIRKREQVQGIRHLQPLPAIALTSLGRSEDRLQALNAGFQMHVPKPVELAELVLVITTLIGGGQMGAALN